MSHDGGVSFACATPIAVVGAACRLPGGVESPHSLLEFLRARGDGVVKVPDDRWSLDRYFDADPACAGRMHTRFGGFLQGDVFAFDARAFGISPREAAAIDPQQSLLLEVAWESLEDAGVSLHSLAGSATGVFVGAFGMDNVLHGQSARSLRAISSHTHLTSATLLSARIAYALDLRGPTLTVDTACSSSLVAAHLACVALQRRECDAALVGGVHVMSMPAMLVSLSKGHFVSPDGRSKAFDASANGYGRGEGAVVLTLKRLEDAVRDGDRVYSVLLSSGVNQDGRTEGITVPSVDAQAALIQRVCRDAGISMADVGYVEAHGTGTPVGDPIEASVLGATYGQAHHDACAFGSIKSNIGHLEAAAGAVGLLKVTMMRHRGVLVPQRGPERLNASIDLDALNLRFASDESSWPTRGALAAVNSFGYGGTNAHVVVGPAPPAPTARRARAALAAIPLSAYDSAALAQRAAQWLDVVRAARLQRDAESLLCDVAFTLQRRRSHLPSRACVMVRDEVDLVEGLAALSEGREDARVVRGEAAGPLATAWVFTGMGPQRAAMGRELLSSAPAFRAEIEACDAIFAPLAGWSIVHEMRSVDDEHRARRNDVAQVMNFAVQAGLAAMLRSLGAAPSAIVGHSVGEIAAAYAAGALTREDAVRVIYHRSIATQRVAGRGTMLAAGVSEADARWLIGPADDVSVAAINSPTAVSLAGARPSLERIADELQSIGLFARLVPVEVAYHSAHLEPVRDELLRAWAQLSPRAPRCALYSTVRGSRVEGPSHDAEYWWSNARQPVLFSAAIEAMIRDGIRHFVEVGPHPVLAPYLRELFSASGARASCAPTLKRGVDELASVHRCVAESHCLGASVDWTAPDIAASGAMVAAPAYPWQRRRHWSETRAMREERLATDLVHPLLNERIDGPAPGWTTWLDQSALSFLWDHQVQRTPIAPGALYVELFAALARQQASVEGAVHLKDVRFHAALALARSTQLSATASGSTLAIHSRLEDSTNWTLHATAAVDRDDDAPRGDSLDELCSRARREVDVDVAYRNLEARGLQYGPSFRSMRALHVGVDDVFVTLCADDPARALTDSLSLSPVLLDGAFQALIALLDDDLTATLLPVGIDRVTLLRPAGSRLVAHGRLIERSAEEFNADLALYTEAGELVAALRGLRCKRVAAKPSSAADVLTSAWVALDASPPLLRGGWAVYGDNSLSRETLAALRSAAAAVAVAELADGSGALPPVAHHVVCVEEPRDLFVSVRALTVLASRLARGGWTALTVCTRGAVSARGAEPCSPTLRALWGAMRSAARELPSLRIRLVDIAADARERAIVDALSMLSEDELAVRGDALLSARLLKGRNDDRDALLDPARHVIEWPRERPPVCLRDASAIDPAHRLVVERVLTLVDGGPGGAVRIALAQDVARRRFALVVTDGITSVIDAREQRLAWCAAEPEPGRVARAALRRLMRTLGVSSGSTLWLSGDFAAWRGALEALGLHGSSEAASAAVMLCSSVDEAQRFAPLYLREGGTVVLFSGAAGAALDLSALPAYASVRQIPLGDWLMRELVSIAAELDDAGVAGSSATGDAHGLQVSVTPRGVVAARDLRRVEIVPTDVWWITGGTRGFALEAARELARRGARRLVLASRAGRVDAADQAALSELRALGVDVELQALDVSDPAAVQTAVRDMVARGRAPRAIIHGATVYADEAIDALSRPQFERVFSTKATGAWNLHRATEGLEVRHFILCSSISGTLGNAGQISYAAANAFLDGLAELRLSSGLAALSVAWGAIGGAGVLARDAATARHLDAMGLRLIAAPSAWQTLFDAHLAGAPTCSVLAADWGRIATSMGLARSSRVATLVGRGERASAGRPMDALLEAADPAERLSRVTTAVKTIASEVLRLPADQLAEDRPLRDVGLDSLLAAEIRVTLQERLGVELSAMSILSGASARDIARSILAAHS